jgi:hypothetical protein
MSVEHETIVFSYGQRWEWECTDCGDSGKAEGVDTGALADCWAAADAHRMASAADPKDAA